MKMSVNKNKSRVFLELLRKNPFVLAPMESITNLPYRELFDNYVAWTVSEMLSADALIKNKIRREVYLRGKLKFNVIQLFGNDKKVIFRAAKMLEDSKEVDGIDLNFGCPSPRLTKNGMGAALLKEPKKIYEIAKAVKNSVSLPVSAKIRVGFDKYNYIEVIKQLELAGVDLIVVHGRTAKQGYSGKADWQAIKEITKLTNIPVVGNGDVNSKDDLNKLGFVSGLMIGRASMGDLLLFENLLRELDKDFDKFKNNSKSNPVKLVKKEIDFSTEFFKVEIQKELLLKYVKRARKLNLLNLKDLKTKATIFLKGIPMAKKLRMEIIASKSIDEVIILVENFAFL